jgi:hypothetical protein
LKRYSTKQLNDLSASSPGIGIFYVLFICFGADLFLGRAGAIILAHTWNSIGLIILTIWDVPKSAKWFAFNTNYSSVAMSSVLYGWANDILKHEASERSFALIAINSIAQSTTAWTPLLTYKTVEAPRFPKGYPFSLDNAIALILMTLVVKYLHEREEHVISGMFDDSEADRVRRHRREQGYLDGGASSGVDDTETRQDGPKVVVMNAKQ